MDIKNNLVLKQKVLNMLPITQADLGKKLNVDSSKCSRILAYMIKDDLITRTWLYRGFLIEIKKEVEEELKRKAEEDIIKAKEELKRKAEEDIINAEEELKRDRKRVERFIDKHQNSGPKSLFNNTKLVKKIMMGCPLSEEDSVILNGD